MHILQQQRFHSSLGVAPRHSPQTSCSSRCLNAAGSRRLAHVAAAAPLASTDRDGEKQQQKEERRSSKNKSNNSSGPDEQPEPPRLPPQLTQLLALLVEFAGKLGTAAVVIAWFTNVDPFGGLHWNEQDVLLGLKFFLPLMLLDAALMLPDYSVGPEDSREVAGLFLGDPDALNNWTGPASSSNSPSASMDAEGSATTSNTSSSSSSSSRNSSGASTGGVVLRLRLAMEVLQQVYTRANPGIGLSPAQELLVLAVASLAEEMLYRAVGLTLLGLWIRDRLYEAGFDETVSLSWLTPQLQELPTPEFARWAAVALVAALGTTGFALGALRELAALQRIKLLDKNGELAESEAAAQVKAQLVASLGGQNLVMYAVEGVREVSASVMAGAAFVVTGNLAAPLAGSVAVQTLFSLYQRLSLSRAKTKRKAMLLKMKARSDKLQSAMAAAVAARKAEAAAAPAEAAKAGDAGDSSAEEAGSGSGSSSGDHNSSDATSPQQQDEVDFLTAVLQAAEKQQEQERQQRLRPQHTTTSNNSSSSSSDGTTAPAAVSADTTAADWAAPSADSSSLGSHDSSHHEEAAGAASSSSNSSSVDDGTQAADAAAARQKLSVLLEDMLRSPEGMRVVRQWMDSQPATDSSSSSSSSSKAAQDPQQTVEQLLADPATKAKLLAELEEQLFGMSEAAQRRAKQQETGRR